MFSQTAEYALRAAVAMAQNLDQPLTTSQMAERTRVPAGYLSKVLQIMVRAKVVTAIRGLHGGYQLSRPAAEVSILEVINAVDPLQRIVNCPLGIAQHGVNLCPLHRKLDDAIARVEQAFATTTLAELIREPSGSMPLCPGPVIGSKR